MKFMRYYSNVILSVTIETEHYTLPLKRNIIRYYLNGTLYVTEIKRWCWAQG